MKASYVIVLFLLSTTLVLGQNKEKIKGSKTVVEKPKEIEAFTALEIEDNLTVFLEKGSKNEIKIEADENLHEIVLFDIKEKTLRIYTSKEAGSFKKLTVWVKYTEDLKSVLAKNNSVVNAIESIQLNDITFSTFDFAQLYLNVNSKNFTLKSNDKTKTELNLKAEKAKIELSKNAQIKALISTIDLSFDMYQKSIATIEGDATNATIRLDNNTVFTGSKFNIKNSDVTTEGYSVCNVLAETKLAIDASDNSKIFLFGTPQQIEVRKFLGEAQFIKKLK
jgi:hypothetical protein